MKYQYEFERLSREEQFVYETCLDYTKNQEKAMEIVVSKRYNVYYGCRDLEDVLLEIIKQKGLFRCFNSFTISSYVDFNSYADDLERYSNDKDIDFLELAKDNYFKLTDSRAIDYLDTYRMSRYELEKDNLYLFNFCDCIEIDKCVCR